LQRRAQGQARTESTFATNRKKKKKRIGGRPRALRAFGGNVGMSAQKKNRGNPVRRLERAMRERYHGRGTSRIPKIYI